MSLEWMGSALCAQTDPEVFFPEKGSSTTAAKRICAACPVTEQCRDHALSTGQEHGVWGGMSDRQRKPLRERTCRLCGVAVSTTARFCPTCSATRRAETQREWKERRRSAA